MIDPEPERWRRLSVKEGWRQFVCDEPTRRPERIGIGEYRRLDASSRSAYDLERLRHAHGFGPIRSLYADIHRTLERLAMSNELRGPGARHGAALDGNPGNGKTTIASHFGRHWERRCRERYPHELTADGHEYLPVVYVNVDALPTIKGLNHAILAFYGMGPPRYAKTRELTQLVLECARCCRTSLIVIDDIHLLELRREADRDANNHLKRLANDLQATFLYAGVGLAHGGFMHEGLHGEDAALAQISLRFKRLPVEPLRRSTQAEKATWLGVLRVFEQELVLLRAKDGDLTGQADYLWRRSQGVIGSLTQLLTEATAEAIDTGSERITRKLLDAIDVGYAAEVGAGRQPPRRAVA
ncbi:MAG: TniB family NTP-binding protein [Solirubrobacteraceae bacterium]